jgi:hypothetical protein
VGSGLIPVVEQRVAGTILGGQAADLGRDIRMLRTDLVAIDLKEA